MTNPKSSFPIAIAIGGITAIVIGAGVAFWPGSADDTAMTNPNHLENGEVVQRPTGAGSTPEGIAGTTPRIMDGDEVIEGSTDAARAGGVTDPDGAPGDGQTRALIEPQDANTAPGAGTIDNDTGQVTTAGDAGSDGDDDAS
ncbi:hypothetical protein [Pseudaestuariivita sp.]|uniref:hypothetical protein n=1 Tax=Pseudaestuariivita sp. TaxID=2211669 RepID=UPI0040594824